MPKTAIHIGPQDHGRKMDLRDFDTAEVQEGLLYELEHGKIIVSEVPNPAHMLLINAVRRQLAAYDLQNAGRIYSLTGGAESKLLIGAAQSERHPDLSVYTTPPPSAKSDVWAKWIPAIVVEIVSAESVQRDYVEKRAEYLLFGIQEYWIVDPMQRQVMILTQHNQCWTETILRAGAMHRTSILPGLDFSVDGVFNAIE